MSPISGEEGERITLVFFLTCPHGPENVPGSASACAEPALRGGLEVGLGEGISGHRGQLVEGIPAGVASRAAEGPGGQRSDCPGRCRDGGFQGCQAPCTETKHCLSHHLCLVPPPLIRGRSLGTAGQPLGNPRDKGAGAPSHPPVGCCPLQKRWHVLGVWLRNGGWESHS